MKGLNEVRLIGNLGANPEMRYTPNGKPVTTFTLATSRKFKNESDELVEATEWHSITSWGALAETINQHLDKGAAVYVSGRLRYNIWQGTDGSKHSKTEIVAEDCIFLDKPKASKSAQSAIAADARPAVPQPLMP